ncbi:Transmembrane amino acid transporter protein [Trichomonas vaginalis G3]|uniref:Transmembrane amino acid transporter protein n=1 Tax=Trichomonas vaginalis (strain ATCC PRA-98 / G3) TaxID=412133 RepID=A2F7A5_TRIV3|nr:amino acid transmembrane transporter protein [Trichomonas vaginalis G3]EAX99220.1 Transmembrane amino acid transporter protein [Trichomonas vaginalis G3]KAI5538728.1 amino acid transmembrane transporter protein [Trichomonas vaginalis G3]|eukprot:XP_001312150.1 Transmembrane amino acid transporter protein [Trichomonas vaginalis G3]
MEEEDGYVDTEAQVKATGAVQIGVDGLPVNHTADTDAVKMEEINLDEEHPKEDTFKGEGNPNRVRRFATIMNLLNSLLGAGILSVPSSFINIGLFPSIALLSAIAVISYFATAMIMTLQIETESAGFDELTLKVSGRVSQIILSVLTLLFLEFAMLAYIILAGDFIISWFNLAKVNLNPMWRRAAMILIYSLVLPVALTIPRSIKFLSYFSTATVFFILLFVLSMIIRAGTNFPKSGKHHNVSYGKMSLDLFYALAIHGLAFSLPIIALPIVFNYNKTIQKRKITAIVATILCFVLVLIPSVIGYLLFGDETNGNVLKNFPDNDVLMIIVRIGFFFVVTFSYPCVAQPVMGSWGQMIYGNNDAPSLTFWQRVIVEVITHTIPIIIAMFLPESKPILGVGGALGGCVVDFCYPALLWYLHYKPSWKTLQFWLVWALGIFGLVTGIISTYQAVKDVINAFKKV